MKRTLLIIGLAGWLTTSTHAALLTYTFETDVATPNTMASGIEATSFAISAGTFNYTSGCAPTAATAISDSDWRGSEGAKWWEFTVTPAAGSLFNLTAISFDDQRSGTGAAQWSLSVNGVMAVSNQSTHTAFGRSTVDLSGSSFQGLSAAAVCIYGYNGTSSSGTWRLDNVTVEGSVTAVPEPTSWALLLGGGLVIFAGVRRWPTA
jgi:hypothetical protein